jgi:hypothetical protein
LEIFWGGGVYLTSSCLTPSFFSYFGYSCAFLAGGASLRALLKILPTVLGNSFIKLFTLGYLYPVNPVLQYFFSSFSVKPSSFLTTNILTNSPDGPSQGTPTHAHSKTLGCKQTKSST